MNNTLHIARKEFAGFFTSPIAFIFFSAFLLVTLFVFFWVETFFARNLADVRPLFERMPLLLIFLVTAVTMRMWSEERRAGTLELLLTSPVRPLHLVLGKFFACLALVTVALALTLPLPLTISLLGPLDWGPVFGGYLAALFLAAAYVAIGLFVSARSENQIVSLILAVLVCGFFYLLGADALTGLFGNKASEYLKLLGSGSRFQSITRGVIDLRDLYYYLSLVGVFLALNLLALERQRWAGNTGSSNHRRWGIVTGLCAVNFLVANLWLSPVGWIRADLTQGKIYTISAATRNYMAQLREPLLIRGYFSAQTHPLLAPLVPRMRDLLEEYALSGKSRVRVEFIDPREYPELEQEAGEKYGIKPVPFQFASKYRASVVNSYFNILIQYGDQHETLGFRDLVEVKMRSETDLDVDLRNPEYDITRSIKKVLYAYQGAGGLLENISHQLLFKGYLSPVDRLPGRLKQLHESLHEILSDLRENADGKLSVEIRDPDADDGVLAAKLKAEFGFRPMVASPLDTNTFWFYMTLEGEGRVVQIGLPENLDKVGLERTVQAGLKRFSKGLLKTVALHTPVAASEISQLGLPGDRFNTLRDILSEEHALRATDLKKGQVPNEADLLLLAAPDQLDDKQRFAIDQFLMRGGTVILASSPFDIESRGGLAARHHDSGLNEWLHHHGIILQQELVLDQQNAAFPLPVNRNLAGFVVRETKMVDYPFFTDVRERGMDRESGLTTGIDQVTLTWSSPITLDETVNKGRRVTRLLRSSGQAWTSSSLDIQPDFRTHGSLGFHIGNAQGAQLLAVAVEGRFNSFFKDIPSPLAVRQVKNKPEDSAKVPEPVITRVIERSPESARIILFASNSFLTDDMLNLASSGLGTRYLNPVRLIENAVDWSLQDRGLLAIRGRGHFTRTLEPLNRHSQMLWEYLNYGLALLGLFLVWLTRRQAQKRARARYASLLAAVVSLNS